MAVGWIIWFTIMFSLNNVVSGEMTSQFVFDQLSRRIDQILTGQHSEISRMVNYVIENKLLQLEHNMDDKIERMEQDCEAKFTDRLLLLDIKIERMEQECKAEITKLNTNITLSRNFMKKQEKEHTDLIVAKSKEYTKLLRTQAAVSWKFVSSEKLYIRKMINNSRSEMIEMNEELLSQLSSFNITLAASEQRTDNTLTDIKDQLQTKFEDLEDKTSNQHTAVLDTVVVLVNETKQELSSETLAGIQTVHDQCVDALSRSERNTLDMINKSRSEMIQINEELLSQLSSFNITLTASEQRTNSMLTGMKDQLQTKFEDLEDKTNSQHTAVLDTVGVLVNKTKEEIRSETSAGIQTVHDQCVDALSRSELNTLDMIRLNITTSALESKQETMMSRQTVNTETLTSVINTIDTHLGNCNFETGTCGWSNVKTDTFDWSLSSGETSTGSSYTELYANDIHSKSRGHYIYIDAPDHSPGDNATLQIDMLPSPSQTCLQFYYNMHGVNIGTLSVWIQPMGASRTKVWDLSGNQGRGWRQATVYLRQITQYQVFLEAVVGDCHRGGIAIDDVTFKRQACSLDQSISDSSLSVTPASTDVTTGPGKLSVGKHGLEVIFLVDVSSSMSPESLSKAKQFMKLVVEETGVSKETSGGINGTRFALISFANKPTLVFNLNHADARSKEAVKAKIDGINGIKHAGDGTSLTQALGSVMLEVDVKVIRRERNRKRNYSNKVLFVFTDPAETLNTDDEEDVIIRADSLHYSLDCEIFWIGSEPIFWKTVFPKIVSMPVEEHAFSLNIFRHPKEVIDIIFGNSIEKSIELGNCNFEAGTCGWSNVKTDTFDWSLNTRYGISGPSVDHTYNTATGHYMYIDASRDHNPGDNAILQTGMVRAFSPTCMQFYYNMYDGYDIGTLRVWIQPMWASRTKVWELSAHQEPGWKHATVYLGQMMQYQGILLEANITGGGVIAIDDVTFSTDLGCSLTPANADPH